MSFTFVVASAGSIPSRYRNLKVRAVTSLLAAVACWGVFSIVASAKGATLPAIDPKWSDALFFDFGGGRTRIEPQVEPSGADSSERFRVDVNLADFAVPPTIKTECRPQFCGIFMTGGPSELVSDTILLNVPIGSEVARFDFFSDILPSQVTPPIGFFSLPVRPFPEGNWVDIGGAFGFQPEQVFAFSDLEHGAPGPIVGAGLPGVLLLLVGGLLWWRRKLTFSLMP